MEPRPPPRLCSLFASDMATQAQRQLPSDGGCTLPIVSGWAAPEDFGDELVRLRGLRMTDADWLFEGYNDPAVRLQTEQPEALLVGSEQTARELVHESQRRASLEEHIALAICRAEDDEPVGMIELNLIDPAGRQAEAEMFVLAAYRQGGYGTAAARLVRDWALGPLGLRRLWAEVDGANSLSLALLRGAGFHEASGVTLPDGLPSRPTSRLLHASASAGRRSEA